MNTFWADHIPRFVIVYFILANLVAIILFPGGNHLDSTQVGYDFTRNFFSELGFYKTFSDDINFLSAFFFNSAMFLFVAQGFGFLFMPFFFKENKKAYIFAWLGAICIFLSTIFAKSNIRVNSVSYGPFPSNKVKEENPYFIAELEKKTHLKRVGYPSESVGIIKFLLSSESSFITGADIPVDGGWTSW